MRSMKRTVAAVFASGCAALAAGAAQAHHSFAMYDGKQVRVFTGVVVKVIPDAYHFQIYFVPLDAERKAVVRDQAGNPQIWSVEMDGAAASAADGITESSFAPGTIMSTALYPLRSGQPGGSRGKWGLFTCPAKTPPEPGKNCDSVTGSKSYGAGILPEKEGALAEEYNPDRDRKR